MTKQKTIIIFCANCQAETPHTGEVDLNGELVFTCTTPDCGRFVKLPADMTADEARAYFVAHKEANIGQVSVEKSATLLDDIMNGEAEPDTAPVDATPAAEGETPAE